MLPGSFFIIFTMEIPKLSDTYLSALYLKSKNNFTKGYDENIIAKLIEIDNDQANKVKIHLMAKNLIEKPRLINSNKVTLTSDGIDYVIKLRENRVFKIIRFKQSYQLPISERASIDFVYYYDIVHEDGATETKTITASISDVLSAVWRYKLADLEKVLLQAAKDKIIEKLKDGTLTDAEEFILLLSTHPEKPNYNPANLVETIYAEYEILPLLVFRSSDPSLGVFTRQS
jgi:hypothetical protein